MGKANSRFFCRKARYTNTPGAANRHCTRKYSASTIASVDIAHTAWCSNSIPSGPPESRKDKRNASGIPAVRVSLYGNANALSAACMWEAESGVTYGTPSPVVHAQRSAIATTSRPPAHAHHVPIAARESTRFRTRAKLARISSGWRHHSESIQPRPRPVASSARRCTG